MELINATRMVAGYTLGLAPNGRESLVVAIKGTFRFPHPDEPPGHFALHDEQQPLVMADSFSGEPGRSAPVREIDFAPRKPRCDILLLGSAHAPAGYSAARVDVELRVGPWRKAMSVFGPRHWELGIAGAKASPAGHFLSQPISYDVAFGGTDLRHEDPAEHAAFMANPVGRGFHKHLRRDWIDGAPLPSTEEIGRATTDPRGAYRPMAFGPLGRSWEPRAKFAGTYDQAWLDDHFPFLPPDFDEQYFQAAPADQQVPLDFFEHQATEVELTNLVPEGRIRFVIPKLLASVNVFPRRGPREDHVARLDTLVIEPDLRRFTATWRMARPLRKNLLEIGQVLVGRKGREWWQQWATPTFPIRVIAVPMRKPVPESA